MIFLPKKPFIFAIISSFLAVSLFFTACDNGTNDASTEPTSEVKPDTPTTPDNPTTPDTPTIPQNTFTAKLLNAKDGDIIDFGTDEIVLDKKEYAITKSLTIKNGTLKGITLKVEEEKSNSAADKTTGKVLSRADSSKIKLILDKMKEFTLNVNTPSAVTMTESEINSVSVNADSSISVEKSEVQNVDVKSQSTVAVENSDVKSVDIQSKSTLTVTSSVITTVDVNAPAVTVSLEGSSSLACLVIKEESCLINSDSEESKIESVNVSKTVETVTLSGKTSIENLCTESEKTKVEAEENSEIKIEYSTVEVENTEIKKNSESFEAAFYLWHDGDEEGELLEAVDGVYTYTKEKEDTVDWRTWMVAQIDFEGKPGKSYNVFYDVMTDVDATLLTKTRTWFCEGNSRVKTTTGGKWETKNAETGIYDEGFSKLYLEIPVDTTKSAVTVSVKNIRIQEESEEDAREVKANVWSEKDFKDVEVFTRENEGLSEAVVTFKGTYKSTEYWKQGAVVWMITPKEGYGLYKITYTVNAQNETNGFRTGTAFGNNDQSNNCGWSWSEVGYLPAGQDVEAISYIVYQKGHIDTSYGEIDSVKNPYVKISISDNIPNAIFLKNVKCELVSGGYADILTVKDYEYGKFHLMWANEALKENNNSDFASAYFMEEMDFVNGSIIGVPANSSVLARPVLSARTDNPWHSGYDNYSYSSLKFYNISHLNLYDGKEQTGISVEGVNYNNDASLFSITNTTNQDKYLLVKFNDKLEFTLTETTNDGYVMNSRGIPELGYWVRDWYNGTYYKLEKSTDDTYSYKFTFDGKDGEYYPFSLYSYLNVFGSIELNNTVQRENNIEFFGDWWTLNAGPLYNGKEYTLILSENEFGYQIDVGGDLEEIKEVVNENPNWYYCDIDKASLESLGIVFTATWNSKIIRTNDIFVPRKDWEKGVVYYSLAEPTLEYPFDWARCNVSTKEQHPEYSPVSGKVRVYVSTSSVINQTEITQPRLHFWNFGNNVTGFQGSDWNNRPYMTAAPVTKTEKSPSGKYKGICKSADGTETVYMTISIDVENGTWSSLGYTDDTFSEEYDVGTALSTLEKDGDKFLLKFSSGINATSEDGWNSITFSGAYVGTLSRISD